MFDSSLIIYCSAASFINITLFISFLFLLWKWFFVSIRWGLVYPIRSGSKVRFFIWSKCSTRRLSHSKRSVTTSPGQFFLQLLSYYFQMSLTPMSNLILSQRRVLYRLSLSERYSTVTPKSFILLSFILNYFRALLIGRLFSRLSKFYVELDLVGLKAFLTLYAQFWGLFTGYFNRCGGRGIRTMSVGEVSV